MTQQIAYLEAVIGADITGFKRGMATVRNDIGGLAGAIASVSAAGKTLTFAVTAPLLGFGAAAVKAASSFDASMRNVNAIAQLTETQFKALSARALEFGATIRDGPQAAAEALYTVFSAGITDPEKAFDVMTVSVKTAEAGLADLNTTVGVVSASVLAYSNVGLTAARASDILTRTVALGVGEMNNFARALPYVTPIASAAGIAFEDVGASLAYLTQMGTPANTAARQLAQAITNIVKPSDAMTAALQRLGVSGVDGLMKKYGNLKDALIALKGTTDGSLEGISKLFGNALAGRAVNGLTNDVDRLNSVWAEFMGGIEGATELARAEQLKSFAAQVDLLTSAASALAITVGNVLMPMLTPLIQTFTSIINGLSAADPKLLQMAVSFGLVAAAVGPLLWLFGSLLSPIGILVGASAALATGIATDWGGIRTSIENAVNTSFPAVEKLIGIVDQFFGILFSGETVMTDGFFSVDTAAESMPVTITGSLWDAWTGDLKEQFPDRNAFIAMATEALMEQHGLTPYQIPVGGIALDLGGAGVSGSSDDLYAQAMGFNEDPQDITTPFGERLSLAITNALPQLQTAFMDLFTQAKEYVISTVLPTLDTLGGDLLSAIGNVFSDGLAIGKNGKSPVYDAIRNLLGGGLGDAAGEMSTLVDKHFPQVASGLSWLVTSIGSWLINEGIPAASRSIGYFVGQLGGLIGQGLAAIPGMLLGGESDGAITTALQGFQDTIKTPFQEGIAEAFSDMNVTDSGDQLATAVAGWIGLALAGKLALALVTQGVGGIISSALGTTMATAGAGAPLAAGARTLTGRVAQMIGTGWGNAAGFFGISLGGALAAGMSIALVAGYILNPEIRAQINALGEEIADTLFGEGWTATARTNIQNALTPILEPFLRPFAEMQATPNPTNGEVLGAIAGDNPGLANSSQFGGGLYDQSETASFLLALNQGDALGDRYGNPASPDGMMGHKVGMPFSNGNGMAKPDWTLGAPQTPEDAQGIMQPLIDQFLPEGPAGTAIASFVTTGLTAFQDLQDGTLTKSDEIVAGMSIFASNAVLAITPLKTMMDQITLAFSQLGLINGLAGTMPTVPDVLPSQSIITQGGSGTPQQPASTTVNFNGMTNLQDIKHELRREGIILGAR